MVAAWVKAETAAGPPRGTGRRVGRKNRAAWPRAPLNNATQARSPRLRLAPANHQLWPAAAAIWGNTTANLIEPKAQNVVMMPSAKPKSPTRLTTKALMAAALAVGFLNQNPISR